MHGAATTAPAAGSSFGERSSGLLLAIDPPALLVRPGPSFPTWRHDRWSAGMRTFISSGDGWLETSDSPFPLLSWALVRMPPRSPQTDAQLAGRAHLMRFAADIPPELVGSLAAIEVGQIRTARLCLRWPELAPAIAAHRALAACVISDALAHALGDERIVALCRRRAVDLVGELGGEPSKASVRFLRRIVFESAIGHREVRVLRTALRRPRLMRALSPIKRIRGEAIELLLEVPALELSWRSVLQLADADTDISCSLSPLRVKLAVAYRQSSSAALELRQLVGGLHLPPTDLEAMLRRSPAGRLPAILARWQRRHGRALEARRHAEEDATPLPPAPWPTATMANFGLEALDTPSKLRAEGVAMHSCLGGLVSHARDPDTFFCRLRPEAWAEGRRKRGRRAPIERATVEFERGPRGRFVVSTILGPSNAAIGDATTRHVLRFLVVAERERLACQAATNPQAEATRRPT